MGRSKRRKLKGLDIQYQFNMSSREKGWCQFCFRPLESVKRDEVQRVHVLSVPGSGAHILCNKHMIEFFMSMFKILKVFKKAARDADKQFKS